MVGDPFYTVATFAASLDCIHAQLVGDIHSNEDPELEDWETLNTILGFLHDREIFTEKESFYTLKSLKYLIKSPQLGSHWRSVGSSLESHSFGFLQQARSILRASAESDC